MLRSRPARSVAAAAAATALGLLLLLLRVGDVDTTEVELDDAGARMPRRAATLRRDDDDEEEEEAMELVVLPRPPTTPTPAFASLIIIRLVCSLCCGSNAVGVLRGCASLSCVALSERKGGCLQKRTKRRGEQEQEEE